MLTIPQTLRVLTGVTGREKGGGEGGKETDAFFDSSLQHPSTAKQAICDWTILLAPP